MPQNPTAEETENPPVRATAEEPNQEEAEDEEQEDEEVESEVIPEDTIEVSF